MNPAPLKLTLSYRADPLWLQSLRWLNAAHYRTALGIGEFRANCRVVAANGRFLCHFIPCALSASDRREWFALSMAVAPNRASNTRRLKNAGGGVHAITRAGTPSIYARARRLSFLRTAREGVFGFEGAGRGGGCIPCAFNAEEPAAYRRIVSLCNSLAKLAAGYEPKLWERQMRFASARPNLIIGETAWSQGVANLSFPMAMHRDSGNVKGSLSALTVFGDFDGGALIFPEYAVAAFLQPGDLLLFDGNEYHGVGPFTGVRLSLVLYLKRGIRNCRGSGNQDRES